MLYNDIKRGDIFYISRYETTGSEQEAGRPAIIVSNDLCNKYSPTVSVVYLTTREKKDMPTHVHITSAKRESTALCEQVQTVARERILDYMATITEEEMEAVDHGIVVALALCKTQNEVDAAKLVDELSKGYEPEPATVFVPDPVPPAPMVEGISAEKYTAVSVERYVYKRLYEDLLTKILK